MKRRVRFLIVLLLLQGIYFSPASAQSIKDEWSLRNCIDYALLNNLQIKKMQLGVNGSQADFEQSKAARFPTVNASAGQAYTYSNSLQGSTDDKTSFTGNYSVKSDLLLFNGNSLNNTIRQQELNVKSAALEVSTQQNSIELAVTNAYLQVLYARELVKESEQTLEASKSQAEQAKIQYDAGYIAESNYTQIVAQCSNDSYNLVQAKNNYDQQLLNLKQLLEFDISQELRLSFPELGETDALKPVPSLQEVYNTAMQFIPEIANGKLSMLTADLNIRIAESGYYPSLSLGASASTGYNNDVSTGFATQLGDNLYQNIGLNLSIPIFNGKQVKTAVSKAMINKQTAELNYASTQKVLLSNVQSAYLNAVSSQSRFRAASEQLLSVEKSYSLVQEQFKLGMKNTVDLLTEKSRYLTARQEELQARYASILNLKLLEFYQHKRIEL